MAYMYGKIPNYNWILELYERIGFLVPNHFKHVCQHYSMMRHKLAQKSSTEEAARKRAKQKKIHKGSEQNRRAKFMKAHKSQGVVHDYYGSNVGSDAEELPHTSIRKRKADSCNQKQKKVKVSHEDEAFCDCNKIGNRHLKGCLINNKGQLAIFKSAAVLQTDTDSDTEGLVITKVYDNPVLPRGPLPDESWTNAFCNYVTELLQP